MLQTGTISFPTTETYTRKKNRAEEPFRKYHLALEMPFSEIPADLFQRILPMDHQQPRIQPWKQNAAVVEYIAQRAEAKTPSYPSGRANFYPEGATLFNGGQSLGVFDGKALYDTGSSVPQKK